MDNDCEVEEIFSQVPSIDLDPGQVNLLLSSLNPVAQTSDEEVEVIDCGSDVYSDSVDCLSGCIVNSSQDMGWSRNFSEETPSSNIVLSVSPLFRPTPPLLSSSFRVHHCSKCDFFSLSSDTCINHESLEHPPPRPTIQCISCPNIFLSLQALKVHLLLDHEVLKNELQSILLLTLRKCEEFLLSSNPCSSTASSTKFNENQDLRSKNVDNVRPGCSPPKTLASTSASTGSNVNKGKSSAQSSDSKCKHSDTISSPGDIFITRNAVVANTAAQTSEAKHGVPNSDCTIATTRVESNTESHHRPQTSNASCTPKEILISSSRDSEESGSSSYCEDEDEDNDDMYTGDESDDGFSQHTVERNDESITKHLQLMEQLKKEKLKANRCRLDNCQIRFKSFNTMDYHKKCHNKSGWKCPECSQTFVTWHSLSLHLWNGHTIDMELYYCNFCSFRTSNLSHLRTSHIWIHGKNKMFNCSVCDKAFKTKKQLRNHQVIHKKDAVRYECKQCKALFSKCHLLRKHYDAVHQHARKYCCNACGHRSASRSAHALHIRTHTKEKKYVCGECSYWTGDHNALRRHIATHSGVRPYSCPHCSYVSISSTNLLSHVNSKHPGMLGDVLFSCPLCPFKTLRKQIFVAHATKHNYTSPADLKQMRLSSSEDPSLDK